MRLSRGRSTPTSRAMCAIPLFRGGLIPVRSPSLRGPASVPDVDERPIRSVVLGGLHSVVGTAVLGLSALPLLVTGIGADHHDPPMPADHPALVADRLDARVHLHGCRDPVLVWEWISVASGRKFSA